MKKDTLYLHGYEMIDKYTGASSIPKYQASTFSQKNIDEFGEYLYTRFSNPTLDILNNAIKSIENSKYAFSFSSGMAAITTVLMIFSCGDHIIFPKDLYGGTLKFIKNILSRFGIKSSFIDFSNTKNIEKCINKNTRAIYIETPSNPILKITDIKKVVKIAKKKHILTIIDNTFMTPLNQKTLELGVDVSINSATKFLNGHSDVIAGVVATNSKKIAKKIECYQVILGNKCSIEDAWLLLRGLKTAPIRIRKSCENAEQIAKFLYNHKKVKKVYYPGLKSHEHNEIHMQQSSSGGAIISFELESYDKTCKFIKNLKIPILAVSLGGVESIISYPYKMSHACISEKEREKLGVNNRLLRLSVGIEDLEDLIEDISQALEKI